MGKNQKYRDTLLYLCYKTGFSEKEVVNIYNKYWHCIKNHIRHVDLNSCEKEQDLIDKKTSVNVQNLGKFYFSWKKLIRIKNNIKSKKDV